MVASLARPKYRRETGLFVAEGTKCVREVTAHFKCRMMLATHEWLCDNPQCVKAAAEVFESTRGHLEQMSHLTTSSDVIAVCEIPNYTFEPDCAGDQLVVALDRVQDPGNLGTIIRLCDWMGVTTILASSDTADVYNPKVVQATMGSIARVRVHYIDLPETLSSLSSDGVPVYGTFLDGEDIYKTPLTTCGVVVMGNEGSGVSPQVAAAVTHRLFIPPYPDGRETAESLNVAVATALTLAEFRRRL